MTVGQRMKKYAFSRNDTETTLNYGGTWCKMEIFALPSMKAGFGLLKNRCFYQNSRCTLCTACCFSFKSLRF